MSEDHSQQYCRSIELKDQPLSQPALSARIKKLKSTQRTFINFMVGLFVIASLVTYRTISLGYDTDDLELFKMGLYIGLFLGVFTGLMIDGSAKRKAKMVFISLVVSTSAGLFSSMLITLMLGGLAEWISSVNILGGALSCMWVLTKYDVVLQELEAMVFVDESQFIFIKKAGQKFDAINTFNHKIAKQERIPIRGEHRAIEEWIFAKEAE